MGCEFYHVDDLSREHVLFSLKESEMLLLDRLSAELTRRTGVRLDPYGTFRMSPEQMTVWAQVLSGALERGALQSGDVEVLSRALLFLRQAISSGRAVVVEGD
jgi:hypothetical protein